MLYAHILDTLIFAEMHTTTDYDMQRARAHTTDFVIYLHNEKGPSCPSQKVTKKADIFIIIYTHGSDDCCMQIRTFAIPRPALRAGLVPELGSHYPPTRRIQAATSKRTNTCTW